MTYEWLIELAWKSLVTSGLALLLLNLLKHRSAAERSWVAHAGLIATLLLPLIVFYGPRWQVEAPAAVSTMIAPTQKVAELASVGAVPVAADAGTVMKSAATPVLRQDPAWFPVESLPLLLYFLPAALLLLVTLLAVLRLYTLRNRSNVLVDQSWLTALAQAQRRMGFKHGTALLVSGELSSPVSWGIMRPVILLNNEAVNSSAQAEAIIAHELAHVARWDWAKLLIARAATALFWFNPLVWLLARHCHQLREEAADDAVLSSDVPCVHYAELLIGAARHESKGLLLAANGVAPGRGSLKRRVARVLDVGLRRTPARAGWGSACAAGALIVGAPLAALTPISPLPTSPFAPPAPVRTAAAETPKRAPAAAPQVAEEEEDEQQQAAAPAAPLPSPLPLLPAKTQLALLNAAHSLPAVRRDTGGDAQGGDLVSLPRFDAIEVVAGGDVVLRHGPTFSARLIGGTLDEERFEVDGRGRLTISPCRSDCSDDDGRIEITAPSLSALAIKSGGRISVAGAFPFHRSLAVAIDAGGMIDLRGFPLGEAVVAIASGGEVRVQPRSALVTSIISGGVVTYWGNPALTTSIMHGGLVKRGDSG